MNPYEYKAIERRIASAVARQLTGLVTEAQQEALVTADRKCNIALNERRDLTNDIVTELFGRRNR